jgi:hypothetical protein
VRITVTDEASAEVLSRLQDEESDPRRWYWSVSPLLPGETEEGLEYTVNDALQAASWHV